tara:strand:- start:250 stop:819 length:570 start_codon:yes stop_codon:yes gene_type:complete
MTCDSDNMDLSYLSAKAREIVTSLNMQKIPHEGPWFLQTYKSKEVLEGKLAERYRGPRYAYTAIYVLITKEDFSAMHRLKTEELWHFYTGSPIELLLLHPDGSGETVILGTDFAAGQRAQFLVPSGTWMGAITSGTEEETYSLAGTTLSPGFEFADYEPGYREKLINLYPEFNDEITVRTRDDSISEIE